VLCGFHKIEVSHHSPHKVIVLKLVLKSLVLKPCSTITAVVEKDKIAIEICCNFATIALGVRIQQT
jgi:hypothetical protein